MGENRCPIQTVAPTSSFSISHFMWLEKTLGHFPSIVFTMPSAVSCFCHAIVTSVSTEHHAQPVPAKTLAGICCACAMNGVTGRARAFLGWLSLCWLCLRLFLLCYCSAYHSSSIYHTEDRDGRGIMLCAAWRWYTRNYIPAHLPETSTCSMHLPHLTAHHLSACSLCLASSCLHHLPAYYVIFLPPTRIPPYATLLI